MRQLSKQTQDKLRDALREVPKDQLDVATIKMIAGDFYLYLERNLMIKDKVTGAIVPFELNWAQKIFVEMVLADLEAGRPVRYIILKARQLGISTVIEALCFWWTSTHRNINSIIMAHEREASKNLYEMFRRFYQNAHPYFQPTLKYNTKSDLTFDADDDAKAQATKNRTPVPGLGSKISTLVAKDDTGRSGTNHFFHGSEVAAFEDSADVISGVIQTIPLAAKTFAFLESTAKGVGGYFFNEWNAAQKGLSAYKPFFLAWWQHVEYELPSGGGKAPWNDYEQELRVIFDEQGMDMETQERKIAWARRKQLEFTSDPKKFFQEYPHTPMSAFLASGNYAFPVEVLMKMLDIAQKREPEYGEIYYDDQRKAHMKMVENSPLKVWYPVDSKLKYTVAVDTAEGITVNSANGKEGDFSVIDVMEVQSFTTVARWRGHIDPDELGNVVFDIGTYYNNALVGVEVNNHGLVTVQKLRDRFYRNLYQRETNEENQFQERTSVLGWRTDRKTKPLIIKNLAAALREGDITDYDPVFIGEAMTYMQGDRGEYDGKANGHDDTVMAKAINVHLAQWSSYDVQLAKDSIYKGSTKIKKHGNAANESRDTDRTSELRSKRRDARASTKASRRSNK